MCGCPYKRRLWFSFQPRERSQWSALLALLHKFTNSSILNSVQLGKLFPFLLPTHVTDIKDFLSGSQCVPKGFVSWFYTQWTSAEAPWEDDCLFLLATRSLQSPSLCSGEKKIRLVSPRKNLSMGRVWGRQAWGRSSGDFSPARAHFPSNV